MAVLVHLCLSFVKVVSLLALEFAMEVASKKAFLYGSVKDFRKEHNPKMTTADIPQGLHA